MTQQDMPTGEYVCECGESFGSEQSLIDHARTAHGAVQADEVERFTCPECGSVLGTAEDLQSHVQSHGFKDAVDRPRS